MPIYEYRCSECGERFEKLVRFGTSTSEIECPKCGGRRVEKLISAFSTMMVSTTAASASACAPST
ncbi:MAG: zinc ribbon domain-containing protein [Chloroflexi bacterium]|nr:zinc ribbon domain-containing protein [Chloroflexota bacterium]